MHDMRIAVKILTELLEAARLVLADLIKICYFVEKTSFFGFYLNRLNPIIRSESGNMLA